MMVFTKTQKQKNKWVKIGKTKSEQFRYAVTTYWFLFIPIYRKQEILSWR